MLPLLVCVGGLLVAAPGDALARGKRHGGVGQAAGRLHLKKANAFASQNKCHHALPEYTKAYAKLHDPVVLFNRAECYRRLGDDARAAADYRAFLKGVPDAPNREDIEARIASLEGTPVERELGEAEAQPPPEPKARLKAVEAEPPSEPKARLKAEGPPPDAKARPKMEPAVASAPPPAPPEPRRPPEEVAEAAPAVPKVVPAPEASDAPASLIASQPAAPPSVEERQKVGVGRWLLLAGLALVVAGGATVGYMLLRPHGQVIPGTELGDYKF